MMLRLVLILLCWFAIVPMADAGVTFFWTAEAVDQTEPPDENGYTDLTSTATGVPAISATAALIGSNGVLINASAEFYAFNSDSTNMSVSAGTIAFWFRYQTFTDSAGILRLLSYSGTTGERISVVASTATSNHLQLMHRNGGVGTSTFNCTPTLSANTTYFIIFEWDSSQNDRRCEVYDSGGSHISGSPAEDLSTSFSANVPATSYPVTDGLIFGEYVGSAMQYYLDNIFIASTYADGTTIYCNRSITSYASYAACSSGTVRNLMMMGVGQ